MTDIPTEPLKDSVTNTLNPVLSPTEKMLQGPILTTLLRLSAPNVGEAVARVAFIAFDAVFIGWLGTEALAGVSIVFPIFLIMQMMSASGLGTGTAAAVARALGAGEQKDAGIVAAQGLLLAVLVAAFFSLLFLLFGSAIYQWLGAEGASLEAANTYSTIVFGGILLVWLMNVLANILRGTGNMLIPASAIVIGEAFHLALAPALILGWGPFPAFGISGAAIAILSSYGAGALLLLTYLLMGKSIIRLSWRNFKPSGPHMREILGIGGFASLNVLQTQMILILSTGFIATYGQTLLAGYGAANRLELLQIPVTFALGSAVITMVATNLGAGQQDRVRQIAWYGTGISIAIGLLFGAAALLAAEQWMGLFSEDPEVISAGVLYLTWIGPLLPLLGAGLGLTFALFGANKPLIPFLAITSRLILLALAGWVVVHVWEGPVFTLIMVILGAIGLFAAILIIAGVRFFRQPN
ncbi:MAG: MATE family efflux transporter [Proteobacteria bacterium]|nr:MATE family efflux transporter [Pseudomonadota bacterium]